MHYKWPIPQLQPLWWLFFTLEGCNRQKSISYDLLSCAPVPTSDIQSFQRIKVILMALLTPGLHRPFFSLFQIMESVFVLCKNTCCRKDGAETMSPMRAIIYQRYKGEEVLQNNIARIDQKIPHKFGSKMLNPNLKNKTPMHK